MHLLRSGRLCAAPSQPKEAKEVGSCEVRRQAEAAQDPTEELLVRTERASAEVIVLWVDGREAFVAQLSGARIVAKLRNTIDLSVGLVLCALKRSASS